MKIAIIGPKGSGKAVFAGMLPRYVSTHAEIGVDLHEDEDTAERTGQFHGALEEGKWPEPAENEPEVWHWRIEKSGVSGKIAIIRTDDGDFSKIMRLLDRRHILPGASPFAEELESADILAYFFDARVFHANKNTDEIRRASRWLKRFLESPVAKRKIVVLTKCDLYNPVLGVWNDAAIRKFIAEAVATESHAFKKQLNYHDVDWIAMESVNALTVIDSNGNPSRRPSLPPRHPLESGEMRLFLEKIFDLTKVSGSERKQQIISDALLGFLGGIGAFLIIQIWLLDRGVGFNLAGAKIMRMVPDFLRLQPASFGVLGMVLIAVVVFRSKPRWMGVVATIIGYLAFLSGLGIGILASGLWTGFAIAVVFSGFFSFLAGRIYRELF